MVKLPCQYVNMTFFVLASRDPNVFPNWSSVAGCGGRGLVTPVLILTLRSLALLACHLGDLLCLTLTTTGAAIGGRCCSTRFDKLSTLELEFVFLHNVLEASRSVL
jgi:hypothetical protein